MSNVSNYIILPHAYDGNRLAALNRRLGALTAEKRNVFFAVENQAGGWKHMEAPVWLMAGNYVPAEDVLAAVLTVFHDQLPMVFACREIDEEWRMIMSAGKPERKPDA